MINKIFISILLIIFSLIQQSYAYPDFISYGYSSCLTCHYNGQGGGALNDYGRALFATEITARDLFSAETDEEKIAEKAKFLVSTDLPWWVRPGLKYRGLWFQQNPGSKSANIEKFLNMQNDVNLSFFFNQKQTLSLITTTSYTTYPIRFATSIDALNRPLWFIKEYYLRYQVAKNYWLYFGQMDKAFGIRQADHSMISRSPLGFGQFDQSQGIILHTIYPNWEVALNGFIGNGREEKEFKQKGFSALGEYEVAEKTKLGLSILKSKNEAVDWTRLALHTRLWLGKGNSVISEVGLFENKSLSSTTTTPLGGYLTVQTMGALQRGYNLLSVLQFTKSDLNQTSLDRSSFSFGGLMFPLPRTEVRLMAISGKTYDPSVSINDSWQLQSQLHIAW